MSHVPVMLAQVLEGLAPKAEGRYVDATFGRGGHSAAILDRLGTEGKLLAIDRDATAVATAKARFKDDQRFAVHHAPFSEIADAVDQAFAGRGADGVLFDFGVSSPQLDDERRGFSFLREGPLDMRMDAQQKMTASDYLAEVNEATLRRDISVLGEERLAARIAKAIVAARDSGSLHSTKDLSDVIVAATPAKVIRQTKRHPATKTFQAIRMRVNDELGEIDAALAAVIDVLAIGGRVCFITFHSLEDRPVKRFLREVCAEDPVYRGLPDMPESARPKMRLVGKAQKPTAEEVADNARARSATLRVAERLR
ncbi:MAG: 16S rRNA (cytosine(1402)-N(4))-methyltransferase RsmH [Pseudomonadota bacterium]